MPVVLAGSVGDAFLLAGRAIGVLVVGVVALWTLGALAYAALPRARARALLAAAFVVLLAAALVLGRPLLALGVVGASFVLALARLRTLRPREDADWVPNEARTARVEFENGRITVDGVRNTRYRSDDDYEPRWETRAYDLADLRRAWYAVVPFRDLRVGAHTFVSFEFEGDRFLAVSIEARKEVGERYGVLPGLYRRFELIYIPADERDLIGLRSHIRGDDVFLYPVRATPEVLRALLVDVLRTAEALHRRPAFYNSLVNTCLTALVRHLGGVSELDLRWRLEVFFPAWSDRLALAEGLIDTDLDLEAARRRFRVDPRAASPDDPDFSRRIRAAAADDRTP